MTAGHRDDSDRTIMVTAKSAGREMTRGGGEGDGDGDGREDSDWLL